MGPKSAESGPDVVRFGRCWARFGRNRPNFGHFRMPVAAASKRWSKVTPCRPRFGLSSAKIGPDLAGRHRLGLARCGQNSRPSFRNDHRATQRTPLVCRRDVAAVIELGSCFGRSGVDLGYNPRSNLDRLGNSCVSVWGDKTTRGTESPRARATHSEHTLGTHSRQFWQAIWARTLGMHSGRALGARPPSGRALWVRPLGTYSGNAHTRTRGKD